MNPVDLPDDWKAALQPALTTPRFAQLQRFVRQEQNSATVFPAAQDIFRAFHLTPLDRVRVVILGQDPYHDDGQAHGLSFSVRPGVRLPPSLRNIYKELQDDLNVAPASHGFLESWARQGVFLLNTVLTVRAHEANSHRKQGWEEFTDHVIRTISEHRPAVCFVLWGRPAQTKQPLIHDRHLTICSPHPSPLSARRGFFGSRPFSQINDFLQKRDLPPIDWQLPEPPSDEQ
jgi:uracil-DNA glycosylase